MRKEARLDWESAIRLKQIQTPDSNLEILDMALNAINVLDLKIGIDQSLFSQTFFQGSLRTDVLRPTLDLILAPPKILISRENPSRRTTTIRSSSSREDETMPSEDGSRKITMVNPSNALTVIS